jgi:MoxR-like ATPase
MPEAQMDRFLMHVTVTYPNEEAEAGIIRLVRKEMSQNYRKQDDKKKTERPKTKQETIFAARGEIDLVTVPEYVEKYMVDLVFATRYPQRYTYELKSFIRVGVSPRGSLALDRCCRTHAWLQGRDAVAIEDVHAMIKSCFRHRIIRGERALEHKISPDDCVDEVLELVKMPKAEV